MRDGREQARFPDAQRALAENLLVLPGGQFSDIDYEYSSCRLPALVEDFYRELNNPSRAINMMAHAAGISGDPGGRSRREHSNQPKWHVPT